MTPCQPPARRRMAPGLTGAHRCEEAAQRVRSGGCESVDPQRSALRLPKHSQVEANRRERSGHLCQPAMSRRVPVSKDRHSDTKRAPWPCLVAGCGKRFSRSAALKVHGRTHSGEKPYRCPQPDCGRCFAHNSNLTVHRRIHTGEQPYVCAWADCGRGFTWSNSLAVHRSTHTGVRPWPCAWPDCGMRLRRKEHLGTHMRSHTGAKPYVCGEPGCGKRYSQATGLRNHRHSHTGYKAWLCPESGCGKRFARKDGLAVHSGIHTREAACDLVSWRYSRRAALVSAVWTLVRARLQPAACGTAHPGRRQETGATLSGYTSRQTAGLNLPVYRWRGDHTYASFAFSGGADNRQSPRALRPDAGRAAGARPGWPAALPIQRRSGLPVTSVTGNAGLEGKAAIQGSARPDPELPS